MKCLKELLKTNRWMYFLIKGIRSLRRYGLAVTWEKTKYILHMVKQKPGGVYTKEALDQQKAVVFPRKIKFSILVPLYNTTEAFLREMIQSVQDQTYADWELCLADSSGPECSYVGELCKSYAEKDGRILYQKLERNMGISGNTNACIDMATGEYLALLDHDDLLHPAALYEMMKAICEKDADFIYTDEAVFRSPDVKDIYAVHFKPDFAIDNLRANNYICHFTAFSKDILNRTGGFRSQYDGSQDHDIILRLTENAEKIVHIPIVLYYWRSHPLSVAQDITAKEYAIAAGRKAVHDSIVRSGYKAEVGSSEAFPAMYRIRYELKNCPKVSVIIPVKKQDENWMRCINSILTKTTYSNYEIVIAYNESDEISYKGLEKDDRILYSPMSGEFTLSKLNDCVSAKASGEYYAFLHSDTEIITPEWIEELLMYVQREDVAAAGGKLYYPDNTIAHAGYMLSMGKDRLVGRPFHECAGKSIGYMGRLCYSQNMSAVSAACMMVKASMYREAGGFDDAFGLRYYDVDLCLRMRKAGYLIVWTPFAELYHHETKEAVHEPLQQKQLIREEEHFKKCWATELSTCDPYFNPNFAMDRDHFWNTDKNTPGGKTLKTGVSRKTIGIGMLLLSLVTSLVLEFGCFMMERQIRIPEDAVSLLDHQGCQMYQVGYEVNDSRYTCISEDPQMILDFVCRPVQQVMVSFSEPVQRNLDVQIFFRSPGAVFTEEDSVKETIKAFSQSVIFRIPKGDYESLRIDINGDFSLENILITESEFFLTAGIGKAADPLRIAVLFGAVFTFLTALVCWQRRKRGVWSLSKAELLFCLCCFAYYMLWMVKSPFNYAPDELMRYQVSHFLFENNRLPVGTELLSHWGFSYAHRPTVLCSQLAYIPMKLVSVFTQGETALLLTARMVSVLAAVGTVYFTIKIAKRMFAAPVKWIMVVTVAVMPQFAFLASYVNNDILAVLGSSMVLYAWVLSIQEAWNVRNALLLAVGISVCALSYYNSYAWILLSIIFFYTTFFYRRKGALKEAGRLTAVIVATVFVLIGYSFIRHLVLYNDLLGLRTCNYYGELYAIDPLKPSKLFVLFREGIPLMDMLSSARYTWLKTTWTSCIGSFGHMQYGCPDYVYWIVDLVVLCGLLGFVILRVQRIQRGKKQEYVMKVFYRSLAACIVITVLMSIVQSYFRDYQPQGRYCYPAFLPVVLMVTEGYEYLISKVKLREHRYAMAAIICTILVCLSLYVFEEVYCPSLHIVI